MKGRAEQDIGAKSVAKFITKLREEEREESTIEVYLRALRKFSEWSGRERVSRETAVRWKEALWEKGYSPVTINGMLAAVNKFFACMGHGDWKVRYFRVQRRVFRSAGRELTGQEYRRLVETAEEMGKQRLALLMETICSTGIRVSEVRYITVEAAKGGIAEVRLKGKIRTILLPNKLCRKLQKYAKKQKITSGEIFLTGGGKSLSRKYIWSEMKKICERAGVAKSKVFPHNLRHLFARTFYAVCRDVVKLADILGHTSIETTRIYLISTGKEYARQLDRLRLVS